MTDRFDDKRINDALALLNEVARDKKAELQQTIGSKYSELKSLADTFSASAEEQLAATLHAGKDKAKEIVADVDAKVRNNPWPFIGGAAVVSLLLGIMLGRSKK
ncbi:MAG: hypothetical protein SGI97_09685 [candidate division Zixibacteria bacterium]|nr:hypothetical protein [candidate division Zixibacteria bacterium]